MSAERAERQPAQTVPGRNPRRRTRQEIDGSSSLRQTRHAKRSKLDDGSARSLQPNGVLVAGQTDASTNGHAVNGDAPERTSLTSLDAMFRNKANISHTSSRPTSSKGGASHILTKSELYQATQLPGVPEELNAANEPFRGSILAAASLCLAVTRNRAFVWSYSQSGSGTSLRVFSLPHPSKESEPLPVAAIVKNGSNSDTGLVVISPKSGKVTFWQNVENAAALSLFEQRRNGTEGSVGSMFSGEVVTDIEHTDPAGFALTFSSGRVAQLSLWDSQSRPSISVRFLKSSKANSGYLGSLWNALGVGGFLSDVVAVRSQASAMRGLADVLVASQQAIFQMWQLSWSNQPVLKAEFNAQEPIAGLISQQLQDTLPSQIQSTSVLDYVISSTTAGPAGTKFRLVCLVSAQSADYKTHALAEVSLLESGDIECGQVYHLNTYAAPLVGADDFRPRICFPARSSTIFVAFDKAITIFSKFSQNTFQDTIYLKDDPAVHATGINPDPYDERRHDATAVLHVGGSGPLRMTVHELALESSSGVLSARTKIEQAVFYGTKPSNPFNLSRGTDIRHPKHEVEEAAIAVSRDILSSKYPEVLPSVAAMDLDLLRRGKALEDLANHMRDTHDGLSRLTKWRLLWDAERLAAALEFWAAYDRSKPYKPKALRLLPEIIEFIHSDNKTAPEDGGDQLRAYLRYDLWRLENMLPWAYHVIYRLAQQPNIRDTDGLLQLVRDGSEFITVCLETAFAFRQKNAWLYGLENGNLENGVLNSAEDFTDLPEFWTSTLYIITKVKELIVNAQDVAITRLEDLDPEDRVASEFTLKIAQTNPALILAWSKSLEERHRWSQAQTSHDPGSGHKLYKQACEARTIMLGKLSQLDQYGPGTDLAEKFDDMKALTILIRDQTKVLIPEYTSLQQHSADETYDEREARHVAIRKIQRAIESLEDKIRSLCEKYRLRFTRPYFDEFIAGGSYFALLEMTATYRTEVTEFLRADPARRKLSWINDILAEHDYSAASNALTKAAQHEPVEYKKRVALAFSKLSLLATKEANASDALIPSHQRVVEAETVIMKIQLQLHDHIKPVLYDKIDETAQIEALMSDLAQPESEGIASRRLVELAFERLIGGEALGPEELVDVLSLMQVSEVQPDDEEMGYSAREQFAMALRVLNAMKKLPDADDSRIELARHIVWRRAFIQDGWDEILVTNHKSDTFMDEQLIETVLFRTILACLTHGLMSPTDEPLNPHDFLEAGTQPEHLMPRFGRLDLAEPLAGDMAKEEAILRKLLSERDLEQWTNAVHELAVRTYSDAKSEEEHHEMFLHAYSASSMKHETGGGVVDDVAEDVMESVEVETTV